MLDRSLIDAIVDDDDDVDISSPITIVDDDNDDDDDGDNIVADVLPMIAVLLTMLLIMAVGVVDIVILL